MIFLKLLENVIDPDAVKKRRHIEQLMGCKIPKNIFEFISKRVFEKNDFQFNIKGCKYSEMGLEVDENKFIQYSVFSFYIKGTKKHYEWVRFFLDLSTNLFLLESAGSEPERKLLIAHKLMVLADIYDDKYWCVGISPQNQNQVYYVDVLNQEIIHAFDSMEAFFDSLFIGLY